MIYGITPHGWLPYGWLPDGWDFGTPDPFRLLVADPDATLRWLVEAYPFDPAATTTVVALPGPYGWAPHCFSPTITLVGGEVAVRLADHAFATGPADNPANTPYAPDLARQYAFEVRMFKGSDPFGEAPVTPGDIEIANGSEGDHDHLARCSWAGRSVTIKVGGDGFAFGDYATVFRGVSTGARWDEGAISIGLRDRLGVLARNLDRRTYLGTGGAEGAAALKGRPVPLGFGVVRQAEPVMLNWGKQIYQLHDGAVHAVDAVRDKGITLAAGADFADYAALDAATVAGGTFATCLAEGLVRLGAAPAGTVTVDFRGDAGQGYIATGPAIIRRLVTSRLGQACLSAADLDLGAFARVEAARPWTTGLWLPGDASAAQAVAQLARDFGGWHGCTRAGLLTMGVLARATTSAAVLGTADVDDSGVQCQAVSEPVWRVRVGWRPMRAVLTDKDMAAGVSDADRATFREEFRWAEAVNAATRTMHQDAREFELLTGLDDEAAAQALAAAVLGLLGQLTRRWTVPLRRQPFSFWLGDPVSLDIGRFEIDASQPLLTVGVVEDAATGDNALELWG